MNDPSRNQHIEDNFYTFNDKFIELFSDIKKGLEACGGHQKDITVMDGLIQALQLGDYASARTQLLNAKLEPLLEETFDNLKLNSDLTSLRIRMANLGLLEADASHYL
ncbi:hypothetical protein [Marinospirillum alkaliphilum]|uniref:Uncharacterized protein n=1 Tax=Marinospirillum alkaliphilum DSM 21637 TaxID=1122209 RepID=A0A1K1V4E3_9GAMM|nr:hypothetical protein [Marinospirillum alkaliphilum]SFX19405.1 hypothetical protein SAMN02745752_00749 [Marinospirillum alkaliphilum DSM 21637]